MKPPTFKFRLVSVAEWLARLTAEWATRDRFPALVKFLFSYFFHFFGKC
jgi:hypothetical protein